MEGGRALHDATWFQIVCTLANLFSACAVVFANKAIFSIHKFHFTVALTCIHTLFSLAAAKMMLTLGLFKQKQLPKRAALALAAAFAGYIVLCNASLAMNTVGFYQLLKIAGPPTMMCMESFAERRRPKMSVAFCVFVACSGIGLATLTDKQVTTNLPGLLVGVASVLVTSQYGIWISTMSKNHDVSPIQLLDQYLPYASVLMAACALLSEIRPWPSSANKDAGLLNYEFTTASVSMIAISAFLGAVLTFTTFLVINFSSPLTYSVVGHVKTLLILAGGVIYFNDEISPIKEAGIALALAGVIAYSRARAADKSSSWEKYPSPSLK